MTYKELDDLYKKAQASIKERKVQCAKRLQRELTECIDEDYVNKKLENYQKSIQRLNARMDDNHTTWLALVKILDDNHNHADFTASLDMPKGLFFDYSDCEPLI